MSFQAKFSNLGQPNRIWVFSAIEGRADRLRAAHQNVYEKFAPGDRIVYTGNYFGGTQADPLGTMNDLLVFRRSILALPGSMVNDIVYLRGIQEELWRSLLRLQMSINASDTVAWIARRHPEVDSLLRLYGSSLDEASRVAREGVLNLTRWAAALQNHQRQFPGHEKFFTTLRRAAFTENPGSNDNNLLFVHAGIDPRRALIEQEDEFWWSSKNFNLYQEPYRPFRTVVRGYDPEHQGMHLGSAFVSLDGGGRQLICAEMMPDGRIAELIRA